MWLMSNGKSDNTRRWHFERVSKPISPLIKKKKKRSKILHWRRWNLSNTKTSCEGPDNSSAEEIELERWWLDCEHAPRRNKEMIYKEDRACNTFDHWEVTLERTSWMPFSYPGATDHIGDRPPNQPRPTTFVGGTKQAANMYDVLTPMHPIYHHGISWFDLIWLKLWKASPSTLAWCRCLMRGFTRNRYQSQCQIIYIRKLIGPASMESIGMSH